MSIDITDGIGAVAESIKSSPQELLEIWDTFASKDSSVNVDIPSNRDLNEPNANQSGRAALSSLPSKLKISKFVF